MRNIIQRLKCWYYHDELGALESLVFAARLGTVIASVSTHDWLEWAGTVGIDENKFNQTRYWLEQRGFVAYLGGRYRMSADGAKWHESLTMKRLKVY